MSFVKSGKSEKNYAKNLDKTICEHCGKVLSPESEEHNVDKKEEDENKLYCNCKVNINEK